MKEYAFDIKLAAVVRIKADSEAAARKQLGQVLDCMDFHEATLTGLRDSGVQVTEASLDTDDVDGPKLFEVDGEDTEDLDYEEEAE